MIEKNKSTMRKKKFNLTAIITLILIVFTSSCKDDWGDHYNFKSTEKSDLNLTEYIKSQGDLSKFAQMLAISGYDTILAKHQTYTVWAPDNSALAGFALTDTAIIRNLVENHITRFSHPTAAIDTVQLQSLCDRDHDIGAKLIEGGPIPQLIVFRKTPFGWRNRRLIGNQSVETVEEFINQDVAARRSPGRDSRSGRRAPGRSHSHPE